MLKAAMATCKKLTGGNKKCNSISTDENGNNQPAVTKMTLITAQCQQQKMFRDENQLAASSNHCQQRQ